MAQQTAVQWLIEHLAKKHNEFQALTFYYDHKDEIAQAKAMEKKNMYQVWKTSEEWSDGKLLDSKKSFEEYYNETYNK